jgi:hypothetical protein
MERLGATQIPPWALRVHSKKQLTAEPLRGTIDPPRPLEQLRQCGSHGMEPIDRAAADGPARAAGIAASTLERCPAKACPGLDPGACPGLDPGWIPVRVKKTRQNKEIEFPFRFNRNGKGSSRQAPRAFGARVSPNQPME